MFPFWKTEILEIQKHRNRKSQSKDTDVKAYSETNTCKHDIEKYIKN